MEPPTAVKFSCATGWAFSWSSKSIQIQDASISSKRFSAIDAVNEDIRNKSEKQYAPFPRLLPRRSDDRPPYSRRCPGRLRARDHDGFKFQQGVGDSNYCGAAGFGPNRKTSGG